MGAATSKRDMNDPHKDKITRDYFAKVKQILRHNYVSNEHRLKNMAVCLDEKSFETDLKLEDDDLIYPRDATQFVHWLDYLYDYLYAEQEKKVAWVDELLQKIDADFFLSEKKYQSQFFFEEYDIQTEPAALATVQVAQEATRRRTYDASVLSLTKNLGGSFLSTDSQLDDFKDESDMKYKLFRKKIKKYTYIFKQHVQNGDHPINIVAQKFAAVWCKYVRTKTRKIGDFRKTVTDEEPMLAEISNELTRQFQKFVVKLQVCLKLFYSRTINYDCFEGEKDELINLITTLLFRTGDVYATMFELYAQCMQTEIQCLEEKFENLSGLNPEDLGILRQFCLNKCTLVLQQDLMKEHVRDLHGQSKLSKRKKIAKKKHNEMQENVIEESLNDNISNDNVDIDSDLIEEDAKKANLIIANINKKLRHLAKQKTINFKHFDENQVELDFKDYNVLFLSNFDNYEKDEVLEQKIGSILPEELEPSELDCREGEDEGQIVRTTVRDKKRAKIACSNLVPQQLFNRIAYNLNKKPDDVLYPYETAIQLLKVIKKYKTPLEKMMIIASLSDEIRYCIDDFWEDTSDYVDKKLLQIEGDQLLLIFIFIVIKTQLSEILIHSTIIQNFITITTKNSKIGYYYSNVNASIDYIKNMKDEDKLLKKDKN